MLKIKFHIGNNNTYFAKYYKKPKNLYEEKLQLFGCFCTP